MRRELYDKGAETKLCQLGERLNVLKNYIEALFGQRPTCRNQPHRRRSGQHRKKAREQNRADRLLDS